MLSSRAREALTRATLSGAALRHDLPGLDLSGLLERDEHLE
jgi:hypothetical protein